MGTNFEEQHKIETYRSMITISLDVFKSLILINGGAAAGMIASIHNIARIMTVESIQAAMGFFVLGIALAAAAPIASWFTQNRLHNENIGVSRPGGHNWYVAIAVILCIGSMIAFCIGAMTAVRGIG